MTWGGQPALLWLAIEAELAIVCASTPALRKFFKKISQIISTKRGLTNSANDKSQPLGSLHDPEREAEREAKPEAKPAPKPQSDSEAGMQNLNLWDVTVNSERSAGSEHEFVTYDNPRKVETAVTNGTFYVHDTDIAP
jgi:hypothetical protein